MTRFRGIVSSLLVGLFLAAVTVVLFKTQAAQADKQVWGDPHIQEFSVLIDVSDGMQPELTQLKQAWSQYETRPPSAVVYRLVIFDGDAGYLDQTDSPAVFGDWLNGLSTEVGGPCRTEALAGIGQLLRNSPPSDLRTANALLMTDGTPRGRNQDVALMVKLMLERGVRLNTILNGWCDFTPLSKPAMAFLSEATGGQLIRPRADSDVLSETLIVLNQMDHIDTILSRIGVLEESQTDSIDVPLNTGGVSLGVDTEEKDTSGNDDDDDDWIWRCLTCLIPSQYVEPRMAEATPKIQVHLRDPEGNLIDDGTTGFQQISTQDRDFIEVRSTGAPLAKGLWQVELSGSGLYQLNIKAQTGLHLAYLGPTWSHSIGRPARILAGIEAEDEAWRPVSVTFRLTSLTGRTTIPLSLHDDGAHGDGAAGDGLYGGIYVPLIPGTWNLEAFGRTQNGDRFRRQDPAPIRVQRSRISQPPPRTASPDSSQLVTFTIHNDNLFPPGPVRASSVQGTVYDLAAYSSQGWAITGTVPSSITIAPGESYTLSLALVIPSGARYGDLEETALVAVEAGEIGSSVTSIARTTVRAADTNYLPILRK